MPTRLLSSTVLSWLMTWSGVPQMKVRSMRRTLMAGGFTIARRPAAISISAWRLEADP